MYRGKARTNGGDNRTRERSRSIGRKESKTLGRKDFFEQELSAQGELGSWRWRVPWSATGREY